MPQNVKLGKIIKGAKVICAKFLMGTSGVPNTDATVGGSAIAVYVNPTATNGAAEYMTCRVESLIGKTTTFTQQGFGLYAGRFKGGVKSGITFKGTANEAYLTGLQAKLQNDGVIGDGNSGGIYACAGLSQTAGAGTWGADAQWYGHWVDVQSTVLHLPTVSHQLNLTNNSGATVTNVMKVYGKITNFADIQVAASGGTAAVVGTTAIPGNFAGYLNVVIEGAGHKIPFI
jgi:hypothetical protein